MKKSLKSKKKHNLKEKDNSRNREVVTFRMKLALKSELDNICGEMSISRSNFILNCVVKEMYQCRGKNKAECKKKLKSYNYVKFIVSKIA